VILRRLTHLALEKVPLLAWLCLPCGLLPLAGLVAGVPWILTFLWAAVTTLSAVLVTLSTGWVSVRQLARITVANVRAQRELLVQQQGVLRAAVSQLSHATVESRRATTRLVAELVHAEEAVRAHIAGELHDTVAQTLSAALMALADVETAQHREGRESVRDAEEQLRAVLARIRPPELQQGSLASAVHELCLEIEHRYGTRVDVTWQDTALELPPAIGTLVYRVVQESLMNSVEHADGDGLSLTLAVQRVEDLPRLCVTITDAGPGFLPGSVVSIGGRHVGLKLARERAQIAGGSLVVESAPGRGTRVHLELPLTLDAVAGFAPVPTQRSGVFT
jgi:signal transduction histidine kinase